MDRRTWRWVGRWQNWRKGDAGKETVRVEEDKGIGGSLVFPDKVEQW